MKCLWVPWSKTCQGPFSSLKITRGLPHTVGFFRQVRDETAGSSCSRKRSGLSALLSQCWENSLLDPTRLIYMHAPFYALRYHPPRVRSTGTDVTSFDLSRLGKSSALSSNSIVGLVVVGEIVVRVSAHQGLLPLFRETAEGVLQQGKAVVVVAKAYSTVERKHSRLYCAVSVFGWVSTRLLMKR